MLLLSVKVAIIDLYELKLWESTEFIRTDQGLYELLSYKEIPFLLVKSCSADLGIEIFQEESHSESIIFQELVDKREGILRGRHRFEGSNDALAEGGGVAVAVLVMEGVNLLIHVFIISS